MLETIETAKKSGDIRAINALIPYARAIGLEVVLDNHGLVTVLRNQESNVGNTQIPA